MVVDVDGLPEPAGDVEEVGEAGLEEWLGVMGRSYGWSDPRAIAAWTELYRDGFGEPDHRGGTSWFVTVPGLPSPAPRSSPPGVAPS